MDLYGGYKASASAGRSLERSLPARGRVAQGTEVWVERPQ